MKNIVTKSAILGAAFTILAMTGPAYATRNEVVRMDIPFSFLAGETMMPSGLYWVRVDGDFHLLDLTPLKGGDSCRVRIQNGDVTRKVSKANRGVLSFRQYGGTLVLRGVFAPGDTDRHELKVSQAEMELAKGSAPQSTDGATVEVQSR